MLTGVVTTVSSAGGDFENRDSRPEGDEPPVGVLSSLRKKGGCENSSMGRGVRNDPNMGGRYSSESPRSKIE